MVAEEMILVKEDVVISGIGGYFPQCLNIEEFTKSLMENKNLVTARWREGERGVCNMVGNVPTEYFDNAFFGIHRTQCTFMDPMQRLIMERTFEALLDAGVNPNQVRGRRIGVFMASSIGENDNLFLESVVSGFGVTGHSRAMMPNRISYWLNLKGPSVAYDANWVGGIEIIRMAFEAIKTGQCESVIVGTANLALNAEFQWLFNDMGLVSPDGLTRAFDANANGYARADGVVVMYIQKASEAKRHYASIVHVAAMFDGNRQGNFLYHSVPNMEQFLKKFYAGLPIRPEEVPFVEAYGAGLKDIDERELEALRRVYCNNRKSPLLIGAVKTNTGHSEASSNLFSIAKVLVAMEQGIIPANLQFESPNPNIKGLTDGSIEVVSKNREWSPTYAAVNGLGLNSYYGHILLKANPKRKAVKSSTSIPKLVVASTRTEEGIKDILEQYKKKHDDTEFLQLCQDVFSSTILGHLYRGYAIVGVPEPKVETEYHQGTKRPIWFVYSGMGSQWSNMAGDLMQLPIFAQSIQKSHDILKPKGVDLLHIITTNDDTLWDNILNSFVGISAIQIALTDVLTAAGIIPDGIIGHSLGELGCAYADGCLTAEQMILAAHSRGRASLDVPLIKGVMAAIGVGYKSIKDKLPPTIEVACHNGPESATLSGPKEDMEKYVAELQAQGVFARLVNVGNIAYHSRYIKPAAPLLLKYLQDILPESVKRSPKWISTSNLEDQWNTELAQYSSAEYHTNNLLSSVYFEEGLKFIPKDAILIEIAPHGLLQAILKRSLKSECTNIALTHRGCQSGIEFLLTALGKLYLNGLDLAIGNIYPRTEYPVGRGTSSLAPLSHWNHSEEWHTGLEDKYNSLYSIADMQVTLNSEDFRECVGHQLDNNILLPSSFYLSIAYKLIANISTDRKEIVFENVHFRKMLTIPKIGSVHLHAMVQRGSGEFEITSNKEIIMTGKLTFPHVTDKYMALVHEVDVTKENVILSGNDIYSELQHRGHKYSGAFKAIKAVTLTDQGSKSTIQWNDRWTMNLENMIQQHLLQDGEKDQQMYVPKSIQKIAIDEKLFPAETTDVDINFNYSTNIISTNGLQLIGFNSVVFDKQTRNNFIDQIDYIPLRNVSYSKLEGGICQAIELTLANFYDQNVITFNIVELNSEQPLTEPFKSAITNYPSITVIYTAISEVSKISVQSNYPILLAYNGTINDDLVKAVENYKSFLLVQRDQNISASQNIVEVATFTHNGQEYSIVRPNSNKSIVTVSVKGDVLSAADLKHTSVSWVSELNAAIESQKTVYLRSTTIPLEGIIHFVQELKSLPNTENVRVLIDLDRNANVNLSELYRKDLVLSIIRNGAAHIYVPIPVKYRETVAVAKCSKVGDSNMTINYIGLNLRDVTINIPVEKDPELECLDYSATLKDGQRVMGIATLNKETCTLVPDPILNWSIPDEWSDSDAASTPYAFAAAYYALIEKAELKGGDTILIHAAASAIGMAAIYISYSVGCNIYVTVSTAPQKEYIKKKFRLMKDFQIFNSDNTSFEPLLKSATNGKGAEVILNCVSDSLLQSSLSCIADFGRFLQIGRYDLEENNSIGMFCFLRNVSFFAVDLDVTAQSDNIKYEIKALMEKGVDKRTVTPLFHITYNHNDVKAILNNLKKASNIGKAILKVDDNLPLNKLNLKRPNQFVCDTKGSYLIYAGTPEQWTDTAEWLIERGAKKVVITSESKALQNHINRRLSLLQSYYGCDINFAPNKIHTKEGAAQLLSEVNFLGPIQGVFLLPQTKSTSAPKVSDIKPVQYIDSALRTIAPKALFVNFVGSAAGVCEVRRDANYPTRNVQWMKEMEYESALDELDNILMLGSTNVFIKSDKTGDSKQENVQQLFKKLLLLLPNSPQTLIDQYDDCEDEPLMEQIVTQGPQEIRELIPLFIIPGLNTDKELEELAKNLLLPTFCGVLPRKPISLKDLAQKFAAQIIKIWPQGPYNILGVSWGGVLVTEVAKILDKEYNRKVYLYFIDGSPATIRSTLKLLGVGVDMEVNLLTKVFNSNDANLSKKLQSAKNWDARVNEMVKLFNGDSEDIPALKASLGILLKRVQDAVEYKPDNHLVTGTSYLIRSSNCSEYDNCDLTLYLKQTPQVHLVNGDHLRIICSPNSADYINETFQLN